MDEKINIKVGILQNMNFTKSDLINGMPVKLRDGSFRVVWLGRLRGKNTTCSISMLDEELNHAYSNLSDVVAVWPVPQGDVSLDEMLQPVGEALWVRREPIQLSDVERTILLNVQKNYKWIAKDEDGAIYVYNDKPKKCIATGGWNYHLCSRLPFENLFNWLSWTDSEPINFRDLLSEGGSEQNE